MISYLRIFVTENIFLQNFLVGFELLLTVKFYLSFLHVEDDEGIGEDACSLHGQPLSSCFGEARKDETFLVFVHCFDFLLHNVDHYLVLHQRVTLEVRFYFFS